ncbi:hypothetical protein [Absidia glauca]|uniref:Major facilitator superfamily (MFS) profile domain-containing protein n=1 Tax=Absidia glauca TaxID=4829 RepID=A0A163KCA1_ABSGL|nr:hypothetical protein [Absidia glauca]
MPPISTTDSDNKPIRRVKYKRGLILLALQASLFLSALDGTIVSTSLPRIGSDFNEFTIALWVANAYNLAYGAFLPLFGSCNDIFGRKCTLLAGIGFFLVGSVLCGVASSMIMLIICRSIAGIGASAIYSAVFVIISEMAPLDKRGSYHGLINAVYAMASIFGPLVGVGICLRRELLTLTYLLRTHTHTGRFHRLSQLAMVLLYQYDMDTPKSIDYAGILLLIPSVTLFLLALNFGGSMYPWQSIEVLVPLVLSVVFCCGFIVIECKFAHNPILPPRLFKNQSIVATLLTDWMFGTCMFAFVFNFPLYLQVIQGNSAMWSGIHLIPMQLAICISSTVAGLLISISKSYRPGLWIGMVLLGCLIGLIAIFGITTPYYLIYIVTVIGGIGLGALFSSTIISLQAAAEPKDISTVTCLNHLIIVLGGSVGLAIANSVLTARLIADLPSAVPFEYIQPIVKSSLFVRQGLPPQYQEAALQVYSQSLRMVWYSMMPFAVVGLISSAFVKHCNLQSTDSSQLNNTGTDTPKCNDEIINATA